MTVKNFATTLAWVGYRVAIGLLVMVLTIGGWQGLFSENLIAIAGPAGDVITAADLPNKTQDDIEISKKRRLDQSTETRTMPDSSAVRAKVLKKIERFFGRIPQTDRSREAAATIERVQANK